MLPEEPHNGFAIEPTSAKPLPEVLSSEDILMHRIGPVPSRNQILCKSFQNGAEGVLANSPSHTRTAEQIL
jgi:hypothetical protein